MVIEAKQRTNDDGLKCVFCKKPHAPSCCFIVTDVKGRLDIIRKEKRCFVCLKTNHLAKDCYKDYECFKCKGRHHVSLCENRNNSFEKDGCKRYKETLSNSNHNGGDPIILQSAVANLSNPEIKKTIMARILFDGCSQRTYVTNSFRKQLKLRTTRRERVLIKGFACDKGMLKTLDVVQVCIRGKTKNINIYIEALCVVHLFTVK